MNKFFKKILVVTLALTIVFSSFITSYEKSNAAGITLGTIALGVAFVGSVYFACDYISNPDKYSDLKDSMKDFANSTVENQKKIYAMEKAGFEYVMDKASDAGVGTCLVGPDGIHISTKQLQGQEYPDFDTWKGYKEKESQKPSGNFWNKFELGLELADLLIALFPDSGSGDIGMDDDREQLYFTGDNGYIDRETGQIYAYWFSDMEYHSTPDSSNPQTKVLIGENSVKYEGIPAYFTSESNLQNFRCAILLTSASDGSNAFQYYTWGQDGQPVQTSWLYNATCYYSFRSTATNKFQADVKQDTIATHVPGTYWGYDLSMSTYYADSSTLLFTSSATSKVYYSYSDAGSLTLNDFTFVSSNIPVFTTNSAFYNYLSWVTDGEDAINYRGPDLELTPTAAPVSPSSLTSPVRQYVNYFTNTFSPSVMPYYVNYNIVNNWDGDDATFNINDYTGVVMLTLTPAPDSDGNDTNITNNLVINQINILTEMNETVTNIYNFFQIDVDYITEELDMDSDENPTGLDDLKNLMSQFKSAFPADTSNDATQELNLLYPKITIQVPKSLDQFLDAGDDKVILEDEVKKIVLCDFKDYAIYFVRFRKFLEIVLRIGLIFYLLKEFTVVFSIA